MSDKEMILLLKDRPSEGLYQAIEKYGRLVRTVARRILPNNPEDVEECVEDTFVNIWKHIGSIDPETATFKAYLLSTARNITINRYRQLRRGNVISLELVDEPAIDDIADTVLGAESSRELKELIGELEEPDKGIFFRRYFLFESLRQIANALGLQENQVKNKLYRGRQRLRKRLEERGITNEAV